MIKYTKKNVGGLTLVELLVVISVLSLMGGLFLTIFTRTLRGNNKSQIIGVIKQNGQSVLEVIDKTIRNSENVVCVSTPGSSSLIVVQNGIYTRYRFIPQTTVNGLIQQDNPIKQTDQATGTEETETAFVNRVCSDSDPMTGPVILTDTSLQNGTSVISDNNLPFFVRDKLSGFKDSVTIRFALKPGVAAPQSVAGQIDPVAFGTTIQLR